MELLLTVEQTAHRLQMHPVSVRRLLLRGQIRGIKRGRVWRIPESALTEKSVATDSTSPLSKALKLVEAMEANTKDRISEHNADAVALLNEARLQREALLTGSEGDKLNRQKVR